MALFTLGSRVLGYVRDAVLANYFGAGMAFDAFVAAHTIPNALRRLVAEGTLMIAYVPLLTAEQKTGGLEAMRRFTAAVLGLLLPLLVVLVGLGMVFPSVAVNLFASGFEGRQAVLAAELTRVMMPFLFLVSLVAVAAGALNTVGRFAAPAAAPMLLNIGIICVVWCTWGFWDKPIFAAAWGVVIGGVLQLLLQIPWLLKHRLLVIPKVDLRHPALRELGRRTLPAVFGVGVYQFNVIIIRQIASFLPQGQMTCYFFASRLQEFALGVFAISISVAALPTLSEHAAQKDIGSLLLTFRRAVKATVFVTVPAMAGLWVLAEAIVATLLQHGNFDGSAALMTAELVQTMAIALIPIGLVRVLVPMYYAFGDTRTPVLASTVSMAMTVGLGTYLSPTYQIQGLTAATVAAACGQLLILTSWLPSRIRFILGSSTTRPVTSAYAVLRDIGGHTLWCLAAMTPVTLVVSWLTKQHRWIGAPHLQNGGGLIIFGGVMIVGYIGLAQVLRISEAEQMINLLKRKIGWFTRHNG